MGFGFRFVGCGLLVSYGYCSGGGVGSAVDWSSSGLVFLRWTGGSVVAGVWLDRF